MHLHFVCVCFCLRSWFGICCLPRSPCSAARLSVLVHHVLPDAFYAGCRYAGKASHTHINTHQRERSFNTFASRCSTQFGNMEGITTAVLDEFPQLRRNTFHKSLFLAALCFCFYLMGLLLVTDVSVFKVRVSVDTRLPWSRLTVPSLYSQGGIYWFTLIDSFSTSFGLIIIALFMCLGISFFYGIHFHTPRQSQETPLTRSHHFVSQEDITAIYFNLRFTLMLICEWFPPNTHISSRGQPVLSGHH